MDWCCGLLNGHELLTRNPWINALSHVGTSDDWWHRYNETHNPFLDKKTRMSPCYCSQAPAYLRVSPTKMRAFSRSTQTLEGRSLLAGTILSSWLPEFSSLLDLWKAKWAVTFPLSQAHFQHSGPVSSPKNVWSVHLDFSCHNLVLPGSQYFAISHYGSPTMCMITQKLDYTALAIG